MGDEQGKSKYKFDVNLLSIQGCSDLGLFICPKTRIPTKVTIRHCEKRLDLIKRIISHSYFYEKYFMNSDPLLNLSEKELLDCLQCERNPNYKEYQKKGLEVFHRSKRSFREGLALEPILRISMLSQDYGFSEDEILLAQNASDLPGFFIDEDFYCQREQLNKWLQKKKK